MSKTTEMVVAGYLKLTDAEKREFFKGIEEYQKRSEWERRQFWESITKAHLGPLSSSACPCCGR